MLTYIVIGTQGGQKEEINVTNIITELINIITSHVATGHLGSISFNSFRWKATRLFNNMPQNIRNLTVVQLCVLRRS